MVDYGHELKFGTFITPRSADPSRVVELAVRSEQLGFDLVTFQDHPYQPALLDAWSLLAFVAARTERVHLGANVANLPLRLPVLLARAATTIDLLSGGRFELGLGAGGFWEAIEAVGGPRRTPGQAVDALEEAIRIIREIWAVEEPGGARVEGRHYSVRGAKRGPASAHPMSISIGAYKPRMLGLTGRSADGWVPSFSYLTATGDLAGMNALIDEAAVEADRAPSDIRRWLNIDSDAATVQRLEELALEYGMSGFILAADDPQSLEHFSTEVMPEVRLRVEGGRARA